MTTRHDGYTLPPDSNTHGSEKEAFLSYFWVSQRDLIGHCEKKDGTQMGLWPDLAGLFLGTYVPIS